MNYRFTLAVLFAFVFTSNAWSQEKEKSGQPNIVVILCDDLGIGDVQSFNPKLGKIKTPNIDQLARNGMSFTDAHSGASVCTPTRYGMLTGRYAWRTSLQRGVVRGFSPCIIAKDRPTIGSFLKSQGYDTALVGKWHLNMRFFDSDDPTKELDGKPFKFTPPVGAKSPDGPVNRGFDYFYGIHHARSMRAILQQDTVAKHDDEVNFLPDCQTKSLEFIKRHSKGDKPFFLYVPLGSPHTPIVPTQEWQGKSGLGAYADFVMQTDHVVGKILKCLDDEKIADNTIVFFGSDNGCSRVVNVGKLKKEGHHVSAGFRGVKADIWDGGHRIPFIAKWPGKIEAGAKSDQVVCLTDLFATIADCLDVNPPAGSCEDSFSFLPVLKGEPVSIERDGIVHHSISGHFAYRSGPWKLILARASGGWSAPNERNAAADAPEGQLYNMEDDPAEQRNLYLTQPNVVAKLLSLLERDVQRGRTTPGQNSKNDVQDIQLWKSKPRQPRPEK
jgi:arylsulfatase A-like enzyme